MAAMIKTGADKLTGAEGAAATPSAEAPPQAPQRDVQRTIVRPAVDIFEGDDDVLVRLDVPGVARTDIDLRFDNGVVTVEAPRGDHILYLRTFGIPKGLDPAGIRASLADGVLTLTLPRAEAVKPRRIEVG